MIHPSDPTRTRDYHCIDAKILVPQSPNRAALIPRKSGENGWQNESGARLRQCLHQPDVAHLKHSFRGAAVKKQLSARRARAKFNLHQLQGDGGLGRRGAEKREK